MHQISCFFLFSFFAHKMMEKHIFTSIWTMQHPNSFQNIQQVVPGGDWLRWLNWTVKVTVKWIDQRSLDFRFLCLRCLFFGPFHVYRDKYKEKTSFTANCLIRHGLMPIQLAVSMKRNSEMFKIKLCFTCGTQVL